MKRQCTVQGPNDSLILGSGQPLTIIGGPCVLESDETNLRIAQTLRDACHAAGVQYIFKASFDKANRTSLDSPRGPGINEGLDAIASIRASLGVPVTTDLHEPGQAEAVASVVDILQIPAFLCRQTDLLRAAGNAAASAGKAVNIKKGQFMAPREMLGPIGKLVDTGCRDLILTERGTFFGYHKLVNDFIGIGDMMELELPGLDWAPPVCFDCTHSAQLPGESKTTGGRRERIPLLARAAVAAGVSIVFMECHPDPPSSRSDAGTVLPLDSVPSLIQTLASLAGVVAEDGRSN